MSVETMKPYWVRLSERLDVVERLRQLPEGSGLNIDGGSNLYFFLRIENENLVLLTENGLGNLFNDPVEEYYPLDKVVYNIEENIEDLLSLRHYSWDFKPIRKTPLKNFDKYCKMLDERLGKKL